MTTYRTGNHWGVTIVREGEAAHVFRPFNVGHTVCAEAGCDYDEVEHPGLVAVVVNGDQALAERTAWLLTHTCPTCMGPQRETVDLVCQTCGTDYARPSRPISSPLSAFDASGVPEAGSDGSGGAEERSGRFEVRGSCAYEDPQLALDCNRCDWTAVIDDPLTLAELNQRADEHTEACR